MHLISNVPVIQEKRKCPVPDCDESFHIWEGELFSKHLIAKHRVFFVQKLRDANLYAEASQVSSLP